jgi:DegV family protein with EDD domain
VIADRGIREVSLYIHWGDQAERESEITDYGAYYERLRTAAQLPTTSQPSIGDFLEVYEPLLDAGDEVVSIHLAGGMSGTVQTAEQAREQLGSRGERVHVFDSATACGGEGLVVLAAAAAARDGGDAQAVLGRAERARAALKMWFAIDTLEYLRRGGRIAGAQAWLGSALKIKPILTVESEITPVERVRTSRRAFERMVDLLRSRKEDGADAWMVQHIQAPREAQELAARGTEVFGCEPRVISEIGPVIGTHVGPGLLGAGGIPSSLL